MNVDVWGTHAMICKKAPAKIIRHHAVNDILAHAFTSAGVPVLKEPYGLNRFIGIRPDGITFIPWQEGKPLAWDATVASTLADSYLEASSTLAGSASESAATRKVTKYASLQSEYCFQPIALESLGPVSKSTSVVVADLGRRISAVSSDPREESFLWQRISICLQRFNSILLHQSFINFLLNQTCNCSRLFLLCLI